MFLWAPRFPFPASIPGCLLRVSPIFFESWSEICKGSEGWGRERKKKSPERRREERVSESLPFAGWNWSRQPGGAAGEATPPPCIPPEIPHLRTLTLDTLSCSASRSETAATPGFGVLGASSMRPEHPILDVELNLLAARSRSVPFSATHPHSQPQSLHELGGCRNHSLVCVPCSFPP